MARLKQTTSQRGFTLLEMMIVVAIIGILSTVGIPTYRRLMQKSKKSEAKVALGSIRTANAAFFSEYNTFGNRITRIGFDIEGVQNRIYTVGFPIAGCAAPAIFPPLGDPRLANYTGYWTPAAIPDEFRVPVPVGSSNIVPTACAVGAAAQNNYTATATGAIAPNVAAGTLCPAGIGVPCLDTWTIDNLGLLNNTGDGIL